MQRTWRRHVIALVALILLPAAGFATAAEIEQGTWEVGAFVAYTNYDNESTLDDSITFGGRGAYFFQAADGIEFDISIGSTDSTLPGGDDFDLTKVFLNYIHNFQLKQVSRMMPFMRVGMGKFNIDDDRNDDWRTTLQFGGGTRVSLSERLALRFDGTLFRWRGDRTVTPGGDFFSFEVTAGVSFFFGSGV